MKLQSKSVGFMDAESTRTPSESAAAERVKCLIAGTAVDGDVRLRMVTPDGTRPVLEDPLKDQRTCKTTVVGANR